VLVVHADEAPFVPSRDAVGGIAEAQRPRQDAALQIEFLSVFEKGEIVSLGVV
jgi:hypothetical protein